MTAIIIVTLQCAANYAALAVNSSAVRSASVVAASRRGVLLLVGQIGDGASRHRLHRRVRLCEAARFRLLRHSRPLQSSSPLQSALSGLRTFRSC